MGPGGRLCSQCPPGAGHRLGKGEAELGTGSPNYEGTDQSPVFLASPPPTLL